MWIVSLLIFIFILGIIILVHEFGHFICAKKSGVYIYEFSIGMGPVVFSHKGKDGIYYNVRAFPIGGFVQMAGEVYEDDKKIKKEQFMCNRPWYQRLAILVAGVFNNFVLALVLLFVIYRKMLIGKIKDYFRHFSRYFGDGLKYWAFGFLVMAVSNLILSYVIGDIAANEEANREFINGNLLVGFCSVVLVAPFVEEMMFRFTAKKMVSNDKWFPLVSAVLFGLAHIVFANNSSLLEYLYVIPYGALGYSFGYAYVKTDNIYTSMFLHAMHNFISFMAVACMA